MSPVLKKSLTILVLSLSCIGISLVNRESFNTLLLLNLCAFGAYFMIRPLQWSLREMIAIGMVLRISLLFTFPNLSDDIYRFIWDGQLNNNGVNVYAFMPSEILESNDILSDDLYQSLNSKDYYSVYPPMMQSVFSIATLSSSIYLNQLILKLILILAEFGTIIAFIRLLPFINKSRYLVALYIFNPLVIVEGVGNLHFEVLMIAFFLIGYLVLLKNPNLNMRTLFTAALFFAFGIMTKLTLALLLPVLLFRISIKKLIQLGFFTLIICLLLFLPFLNQNLIVNFGESLDLYFRSFEFNAGLFYVVNHIVSNYMGWDAVYLVGPILSLVAILLIGLSCIFKKKKNWNYYFKYAMLAYFIYLSFSTTIHPWYIINLIALSVLADQRYPLMWSLVIILSYHMYSNDLIEVPFLLMIEYLLVFGMFLLENIYPGFIAKPLSRVPLFQVDDNPI